jgi:two-component system OmpR family response regulator
MLLYVVVQIIWDQPEMSSAVTVIFAREDLSIPGDAESPTSVEARFFDLVSRSNPDVIVLDLTRAPEDGVAAILTVRQQTDVPILVVCEPADVSFDEYRIAGAADCLPAPVDIIGLNQTIQKILRVRSRATSLSGRAPMNFRFAGIRFHPRHNVLATENGSTVSLTTSEGRLLAHFMSKPWTLCTRNELAELLYGGEERVGDRAIDVVVNRLRKKLSSAGGAEAARLIKTEFRRGYLLAAEVSRVPYELHDTPLAHSHRLDAA